MSQRIRTVHKLGKGKYYTSSHKLSDYLIASFFYWCLIFPIYAFFKYCIYVPIKYIVNKLFLKK